MSLQQFYIGATGMNSFQTILQNITSNVSNAQTVGYKKDRVELENLFPTILEEEIIKAENQDRGEISSVELGSGVKISGITKDFSQGSIETTGKPLDLAIDGEGFFQIRMSDGSLSYTRAGNFRKDSLGNVMDPNGHFLEPPIVIPPDATAIQVDSEGRVFVQRGTSAESVEIGQLQLARFINPSGLKSVGQNLFIGTTASGDPLVNTPGVEITGKISQGSLEFSNVDIISEMMRMVIVQRAFEIVSKLVQSGETMLRSATDIAKA